MSMKPLPVIYGGGLLGAEYFAGWPEESQEMPPAAVAPADDFICDSGLPVTTIRWWGSLRGFTGEEGEVPTTGLPDRFYITIWANEPGNPRDPLDVNHPGDLLYEVTVEDYTVEFAGWDVDPSDPNAEDPDSPKLSKFVFETKLDLDQWWFQPADYGVYWLSIQAQYETPPEDMQWGWQTRPRYASTCSWVTTSPFGWGSSRGT